MIRELDREILKNIDENLEIVERFMGGMSNYTYKVKNVQTNELFSFRVPGEGAEHFTNWDREEIILNALSVCPFLPTTKHFDKINGYKISKYVHGVDLTKLNELNYIEVVKVLKQTHSLCIDVKEYGHIQRLNAYEKLHKNKLDSYENLKEQFIQMYEQNLKQHINAFCHGDSQLANFLQSSDDKLYLVDWEFSGYNDVIYDIACFGNKDFNEALKLIDVYFDNKTTKEQMSRLYAWRAFQCLQWFNVASFKDEIGLSAKLGIDFAMVAKNYVKLASKFIAKANF